MNLLDIARHLVEKYCREENGTYICNICGKPISKSDCTQTEKYMQVYKHFRELHPDLLREGSRATLKTAITKLDAFF